MSINYTKDTMIETMHIDDNAKAPYRIRVFKELKKLHKRVTP